MASQVTLIDKIEATLRSHAGAQQDVPVVLMVSGGSDSVALSYIACELHERGLVGPLFVFHMNHCLRGEASDGDERFVCALARLLGLPFYAASADIAGLAQKTGENVEAVARRVRYREARAAAQGACIVGISGGACGGAPSGACGEACSEAGEAPGEACDVASGEAPGEVCMVVCDETCGQMRSEVCSGASGGLRGEELDRFPGKIHGENFAKTFLFTAHTADDRVENFYMRSIVGTGPGGFRSMKYLNEDIVRPLLDCTREELRSYIFQRFAAGLPCMQDEQGHLWREDATNEHTELFRVYVRKEIVPRVRVKNPRFYETLSRSMNLIADEDNFMESLVRSVINTAVTWDVNESGRSDLREKAVYDRRKREQLFSSACLHSSSQQALHQSCVLAPEIGGLALPLKRRVVIYVLHELIGRDERIDAITVERVLHAWLTQEELAEMAIGTPAETLTETCKEEKRLETGRLFARLQGIMCGSYKVRSGYVVNIQNNLAVSANKKGVRIEPMEEFRIRRKRK